MSKELEHISKELDKYQEQKAKAEGDLRKAENDAKALEYEMKRLTRAERTHRLCTRGGMLESFLPDPLLLTDDDVMEILRFIFHGENARKLIEDLTEKRRKSNEAPLI